VHPIDATAFIFNEKTRNQVRSEMNIEDKFAIGHIGRFMHVKNHEFIIDVFREIRIKNKNAVLVLTGSGILEKNIKDKVIKLGLQDSVLFLGTRSDVAEILQALDVFLFPSYHEGLPLTLIEAQASGLQCYISENITQEVIITDFVRKISLSNNAKFWAKEILEDTRFERQNTFGQILKAGYNIEQVARELLNFYSKV
jgi:glycosyltransferase involved in cell wall biosynthesis